MLAHCIHCTGHLGSNEALEAFQVGKRLAYDPAKGRLWVVCPHCERWNLSPLEERWEAIEDAEKQFRDSRLRVATDEIGLAQLRAGLELVRIGAPLRPEMAAWRYGDQFGRRRRRQMLITGAVVGSSSVILAGVVWIGASVGSLAGFYGNGNIWDALIHGRGSTVVSRIKVPDGKIVMVQRRHARMSVLENPGGIDRMHLRLEHEHGTELLRGADAERAAQQLLPTVNRFGGSKKEVQAAVRQLEDIGNPAMVIAKMQQRLGAKVNDKQWKRSKKRWGDQSPVAKLPGTLHSLPLHDRLALEMALHEDSERRAMDGELAELERAWREAEEIATIADNLLIPESVKESLHRITNDQTRDG